MRLILTLIVLMTVSSVLSYPQSQSTIPLSRDSLVDVHGSVPTDTAKLIDNSSTVELIVQSQNEDFTNSVRESILMEQIEQLKQNDTKRKREMQNQIETLRNNDSIRRIGQQKRIDSLKRNAKGVPVTLRQDTLYFVYTNLGAITPNERAKLSSGKILKVAKISSLKSDSLSVVEDNTRFDIMYGEVIIASITDIDALWMNTDPHKLAEQYKREIFEAIKSYKESMTLSNIFKTIGLCLLVLIGLYLSLRGTFFFFHRIIDQQLKIQKGGFKWLKIKAFDMMGHKRVLNAALFLSKSIRYIIYVVLCYLALLLLFSIFPPTQRLGQILLGWIWAPVSSIFKGLVKYLPNLFKILVIVFVFHYVIKFCRYVARQLSLGRLTISGFYPEWANATFNIVRILLYAFMLVLIFPYLPGAESGVFRGISVFVGILFTLGSTSMIGNLMAGMVITYMRSFRINDRIKIGDVLGDVIEKSPFVIRIKTHKNEIVTVPNSTVLSSNVINYSSTSAADEGLIVNTTVTMGYDIPWRQVNQILIDAALKTEFILDKPQPFVLQTELTDYSASYQLCAYTKTPDKQANIYSQLHQNIQDGFQSAGIEMTTLHYRAVRDGNKSTIPPQT